MITGKALRYGDDISTDLIIPGRYMHLRSNLPELSKHACEDLDPDFVKRVRQGDIVVCGNNFGLGSSREHAAIVLKMNGVGAVVAKSFARIFFRNAINIGLPVIMTETKNIREGDDLEIDLLNGSLVNRSTAEERGFAKLPDVMLKILQQGGLVPYIKKFGDFRI